MDRDQVLGVVKDFLEKRGKLPQEQEELLSYRYLEVGHIDSFSMVQLILTIEDEFDVELKQEELQNLEKISTVGGFVELVEQRINEKQEGKLLEG